MKMEILVLDNYDSFTYNLVHSVKKLMSRNSTLTVARNNQISLPEINRFDKIILSPGPGLPYEAGILRDLIAQYADRKSILGVCLGCQAIAEVFGGELLNLDHVYHGVATPINVLQTDKLFGDLPQRFDAGRYHSWVVKRNGLPDCLEVIAEDDLKQVMALRHKTFDVRGVQFHPESVLTKVGDQIIANWLADNQINS